MKHNVRRYFSSPSTFVADTLLNIREYVFVCGPTMFCPDTFSLQTGWSPIYFLSLNFLSPVHFVAHTFCPRYILSLIRFVPGAFCHWYVLLPIHIVFLPICFVDLLIFWQMCANLWTPNVERSSFYFILNIWPASIWRRKIKVYLINFSLSCSCPKVELFKSIF
jgi:hypothetical protein